MCNCCCENDSSVFYVFGPTGPTGPTGPQGLPASSIIVNSTTTGAPGTLASVTNSGDINNVRLDFVIPQGKTGAVPTFQIGNVTTGNPGTQASVSIRPIIGY